MPLDKRLSGILLHPTSLPGPFGIGDIGPAAFQFLDWMRDAGLAYWQVLPLGPTSFGDSPYQCFSAFAGNPLLVSPELLVRDGLLSKKDIEPPAFQYSPIDYGWVIHWKRELMERAFYNFKALPECAIRSQFEDFRQRADVQRWLDDYALFMALKDANDGRPWNEWESALCSCKPAALQEARKQHADRIAFHQFAQFLFFKQWDDLRAAAHERGIYIIGDAPIYVAYDSADTWANQKEFQLDAHGIPTHVAGVPPDYFSATGQLWGNPIYNWDKMARSGYSWWISRLHSIFAQVDYVRLDHFRGFMGYYAIPYGAPTAETGEWLKGPGAKFFSAVQKHFGNLPIIAEDLGEITQDVTDVRLQFKMPGMIILQFAWTTASTDPMIPDPNHSFIPHRHHRESVVYTGTHDNDTSLGWWRHSSQPEERSCMQYYLSTDGNAANWDLIRAAFLSVANTAIIPAQDFLDLDSDCRMNLPGRAEGNWGWRLQEGHLSAPLADKIRRKALLYERCANPPEQAVPHSPKQPPY
jgi:4-alpha-glucanotransferase